jgi:hypothetical protein
MSSTFVAYVDESGDEGFSFGKGSSQWFVLSAVITRKAEDLQTVKLVDKVRAQLGKPSRKPLHFRGLRHQQRLPFIAEVAAARLSTISVLIHKPSLRDRETFQQRYRLYFYAVRFLLERVSWYCRDHKTGQDVGDGSADVIFSNRAGMPYVDMIEYLRLLQDQTGFFDVRVDWAVIKPEQISAYTPGKRMGLQLADAVAGSLWYATESSQHGFTENRYARMLKPVTYRWRGQYLGYGIKFWPREVHDLLESDERLAWVGEDYK